MLVVVMLRIGLGIVQDALWLFGQMVTLTAPEEKQTPSKSGMVRLAIGYSTIGKP